MNRSGEDRKEALLPSDSVPSPVAETKALLAAIVASSDDAIVSKNLDGYITSWNAGAERIFGYTAEEAVGRHITMLIPEDHISEEAEILRRVRAGLRVEHFDTIRRRKDGTLFPISLTVSPVRAEDGRIVGASKIARDISERKRLEEAQRVLSREVNHRSKNLLSVVQSIIRYTVTHSPQQDFIKRINERLQALSANQDLLIESSWRGVGMESLVRSQLGHVEKLPLSQVDLDGDSIALVPTAAQAIGIAIHELATNAVKFGALSSETGRVAISWRVEQRDDGRELILSWKESGGPAVSAPEYAGFGSTIIEKITGQSVGGRVVTSYAPTGLSWELRAPADTLLDVSVQPGK
jgi:PAS domain S-box-containing protein